MDFSSKNDGVWFYFDDENEADGGVCLREVSPSEMKKIERATTKKKRKLLGGTVQMIDVVDEVKRDRMVWDYCIVSWENVSLDGNVLECTTINKVKMVNSLGFLKWLQEKIAELSDANEQSEAARAKNSKLSSAGKQENHLVSSA